MVVLRLGGLYADIDCECMQPFNQLVRPKDTMVVAWENEFSTAEEASRRAYVRKRQVAPNPGCRPGRQHPASDVAPRMLQCLLARRSRAVGGRASVATSPSTACPLCASPAIAHTQHALPAQVLQWVFAAAPGHPALREMCEHIARAAETMHGQSNRDTLERTGPGPWTDIVLKHARQHPPAAVRSLRH